jgi:hypothetical protein
MQALLIPLPPPLLCPLSLSGLALRAFVALLPFLLHWLDQRAGMIAGSALDSRLATQYFVFQVGGARAGWQAILRRRAPAPAAVASTAPGRCRALHQQTPLPVTDR